MTKNSDRTNRLISAGHKCLIPTAQCFWKDPGEIEKGKVKSRNYTKSEPTVSIRAYDNYFKRQLLQSNVF